MLRLVGIVFIIGIASVVHGQTSYFLSDTSHLVLEDTIHILEVEIVSPVSNKYQVGSKTQNISAEQLEQMASQNLTGLLSSYAPIYIKSNAGGLSSFHFRGTSADHTSLMVGGLTLNSLTLGSSNPSNVPIFLFDKVNILYGSSSASVGSGSIGGSIRLGSSLNWTQGQEVDLLASTGSFGMHTLGGKILLGNGKFESVTRLLSYKKENNFEFKNTEIKDFETGKYRTEKQKYAAIDNINLVQEFNFKFSDKETLTSMFWYANNWHEVQPTIEANSSDTLKREIYEDTHLRSWVQYNNQKHQVNFHAGAGFVYDDATYNDNTNQSISTQRLVSEVGLNHRWKSMKYAIGAQYKHIIPDVYAYKDNPIEDRLDLYSSLFINAGSNTTVSINLRQQFVTDFTAPFTPALGIEHNLMTNKNSILKLTGNIQRSYRIPTLNDRYWDQPNYTANENLKPEDGLNIETGIKHTICSESFTLKTNIQYFYMDVDNWLMWIPKPDGWIAANILSVKSKGVEFHSDATLNLNRTTIKLGANYTHNTAVRDKSKNQTDKIGRQLEYTPKNLANGFIHFNYKEQGIKVNGSYTGSRYYNQEEGRSLDPYFLFNISAYKKLELKKHKLRIFLNVDNVFSEEYQNEYRYAMPMVSYTLGVRFNFKN
ncbi:MULTISPECIES: TonB-dependent receptor plug domain-containing protein [unclassified Saccharicrinis]|uniref:TonB-dependent receptor plug domain-containing protein n=1 Tax=unclassified Saccharicrinis TaxID=2646859 RepID=UPI003D336AA0